MQSVEFVALKEKLTAFEYTESFEFRKDRPVHWLQKTCLFILKKLKAYHFGKSFSVERHTIDAESFMERLWKQKQELHRYFNMKPSILLIGSEDYAELMKSESTLFQPFSFHAKYPYAVGLAGSYKTEVLGLKIHVIPWMRGCLALTRDQVKEIWTK